MIFFNAAKSGFYDTAIHNSIPEGCVEVSAEDHRALMDGQSSGMAIAVDESGSPVLVERPIALPDYPARIADRRYRAETAGILVNGMPLDTSRDSQALVTGAALAAVVDPGYHCQWKTIEGFVDLDAQTIIALASALRAHVQACFDREAELLDALEAGTYTDALLEQGWPASAAF
jgi:hypothetical protein